jgi:hypothetical protein
MEITIEYQPILQAPAASGVKSIKNNLIMQNKPNLRTTQMNVNSYLTMLYKKFTRQALWRANPIKPNSKPFLTLQPPFKAKTNPIKPKQTQSPLSICV